MITKEAYDYENNRLVLYSDIGESPIFFDEDSEANKHYYGIQCYQSDCELCQHRGCLNN